MAAIGLFLFVGFLIGCTIIISKMFKEGNVAPIAIMLVVLLVIVVVGLLASGA